VYEPGIDEYDSLFSAVQSTVLPPGLRRTCSLTNAAIKSFLVAQAASKAVALPYLSRYWTGHCLCNQCHTIHISACTLRLCWDKLNGAVAVVAKW